MSSGRVNELLKRTRDRLDELGDPKFAAGAVNFFKEPVVARGVRSPQLIGLSAELFREIKGWPIAERDQFVTGLWKDRWMENGALACYTYRRFAKTFGEREFRVFEQWLGCYVTNWAHCDGLSVYLLAPCIAHVPELSLQLPTWTRSTNQWKRRAAAVALVKEAGAGRQLPLIFQVATALANDPQDLVQKGAGWLLKETYPRHSREVVSFLKNQGKGWPRLVLRYAAEKMTAQDKQAVLSM